MPVAAAQASKNMYAPGGPIWKALPIHVATIAMQATTLTTAVAPCSAAASPRPTTSANASAMAASSRARLM